MPSYAKFLKEILSNKRKLEEHETVALTIECSTAIQNKLPPKLKDLGSFSIPCQIGKITIERALCDLGSSVSLMPLSLCRKLDLGELTPTTVSLQLADRSVKYSVGVLEDVPIKVGILYVPVDFVILKMEEDTRTPIIHGRPFLATTGCQIDDYMLPYRKVNDLNLTGYTNSNFAMCPNDCKSTSGYIFMLANGAVSWKKFVVCYRAATRVIWLRNLISELFVVDSIARLIRLYCDNLTAVLFSNNNKNIIGSKHLEVKYLTIKELIQKDEVEVEHIGTEEMLADPLTKGLHPLVFVKHVSNMGVLRSLDSSS
ncbi:hypothetical protein K2173_014604 [Erythroxylum novogranatense]|uniref:Uncharacterized protein n=1 Tax=Erythroxylum novogranatense TaxID=1862640 RepID=A0AAV8TFA9_9ROSI|nr:hypothetical protein K2173_014604 [Erythroxylum novogranatense]